MKKKLFIYFLLIGSLMGNVMAQDIITNPLLFVFKLHGQTRKYQFTSVSYTHLTLPTTSRV